MKNFLRLCVLVVVLLHLGPGQVNAQKTPEWLAIGPNDKLNELMAAGRYAEAILVDVVNAAANEAKRRTSCSTIEEGRPGGAREFAELKRNRAGLADIDQVRRFQPLPETAKELCDVASTMSVPQDDIFLAGKATQGRVKELSRSGKLEQYPIVYFATHGVTASRLRGSRSRV